MERSKDAFCSRIDCFNVETLEKDPCTIFGLSSDLRLSYVNPAWFAFASANNGEPAISQRFPLGTPLAACIAGPACDYYRDAFLRVLRTGEVWDHDYECSSPEAYRIFHQSVYPLLHGGGLIVVNSMVAEQPHAETGRIPHPPIAALYTQDNGFITQCSNCRRVLRREQDVWDWVPAWVEHMPRNTSHTFCRLCYEYYYDFPYRRDR